MKILRIIRHGIVKRLPARLVLPRIYKAETGCRLNLRNPQTFNEKLQWLKLYDHNPIYTVFADKYAVREHIAKTIGAQYLTKLYGMWKNPDEIDLNSLPNQFVLKTTHDSGGVWICRDKASFDIKKTQREINKRLKTNFYYQSYEWSYKKIKPAVIAEEFLSPCNATGQGDQLLVPKDYKVYCFDGEPRLIVVFHNRFSKMKHLEETVYDTQWKKQQWSLDTHFAISEIVESPPPCLEELLQICRILCHGFPHLRLDFYIVDGKIFFGEITTCSTGGFQPMNPSSLNQTLGSWITLPKKQPR